jgi:microcin C transport system substrate-binding protein
MKAEGEPSEAERKLLQGLGVPVPEEALGEVYVPPKTDGSGRDRAILVKAGKLLDDAGWTVKDGMRVNDKGEPLKLELLMFEPVMERIAAPYVKNLKQLGIDARLRMVDPAQYQQRLKDFDFDVTTQRYGMRNTPGVELRSYFGSEAAKLDGSLNLAGVADPAVDALIERVVAAKTREDMTTAARALDRVLRAGHYWVPHWYKGSHSVAYWDKFSRPETKPKYDRGILDTWWFDDAKAAQIGSTKPSAGMAKTDAADAGDAKTEEDTSAAAETDGSSRLWLILAALLVAGIIVTMVMRARRRPRS